MKALLIDPSRIDLNTVYRTISPLGICYLAAVAERKGLEAKVYHQLNRSDEELLCGVRKFDPDIVGFSVITRNFKHALSLANRIKKQKPNTKIIFGGDHPTIAPTIVKYEAIDFAVLGEGEYTLIELLKTLEQGKNVGGVKGIAYWENGLEITEPRSRIENLDKLPFPKREDLPLAKYGSGFIGENLYDEKGYYFDMLASRGCDHNCLHCDTKKIFPGEPYYRSVANVINEIKYIQNKYPIGHIDFRDANLLADPKWLGELCDTLIKQDLGIKWRTFGHAEHATLEILEKMRDAGCTIIYLGLESPIEKRLKLLNKGVTPEQFSQAIQYCHDVGIYTVVSIMIGFEDETRETIDYTIDYLDKIAPEGLYISFLTFFQQELKKGTDTDLIDTGHSLHNTKGFVAKELFSERDNMLRKYYNGNGWRRRFQENLGLYGKEAERSYQKFIEFMQNARGINIDI